MNTKISGDSPVTTGRRQSLLPIPWHRCPRGRDAEEACESAVLRLISLRDWRRSTFQIPTRPSTRRCRTFRPDELEIARRGGHICDGQKLKVLFRERRFAGRDPLLELRRHHEHEFVL